MRIRLGLVGPGDATRIMEEVVSEYGDTFEAKILPHTILIDSTQGMIDTVSKNVDAVDVFVFSGLLPYTIAINSLDIPKPCFYVLHNASCIYKTLWHLKEEGISLNRISFDMMNPREVREALYEVGLEDARIYNWEYEKGTEVDPQELADWHYGLWQSGKITAAVTCLYSTHKLLQERGVPSFRALYPKAAIRQTLEEVVHEVAKNRLKATQIAVALFNIDNFAASVKRFDSEYDIQKVKLSLLNLLLDFAQTIQGSLFSFGGDEYIVFSTRGAMVSGTREYTHMPFMDKIRENLSISISCGIGFGKTVYGSEMNARIGLSHAKSAGGDCVFIVEEDGSLSGPLGKPSMLHYSLKNDAEVVRIAAEVGLSATYISKIKAIGREIGEDAFDAKKLAPFLNVTERSARRIIHALVDKGYAREVGEETSGRKGRPRKVYAINL